MPIARGTGLPTPLSFLATRRRLRPKSDRAAYNLGRDRLLAHESGPSRSMRTSCRLALVKCRRLSGSSPRPLGASTGVTSLNARRMTHPRHAHAKPRACHAPVPVCHSTADANFASSFAAPLPQLEPIEGSAVFRVRRLGHLNCRALRNTITRRLQQIWFMREQWSPLRL